MLQSSAMLNIQLCNWEQGLAFSNPAGKMKIHVDYRSLSRCGIRYCNSLARLSSGPALEKDFTEGFQRVAPGGRSNPNNTVFRKTVGYGS